MKQLEEKFLVINYKRFEELNDNTRTTFCNCREAMCEHTPIFPDDCKEVKLLKTALNNFIKAYKKRVGEEINQKYYVCNQDEPYAEQVLEIILNN